MPTHIQVDTQRAINTEYLEIYRVLLSIAVDFNIEFAVSEGARPQTILRNLVAVLADRLRMLYVNMTTRAINIASSNTAGLLAKKKIRTVLKQWQGPIGTISEMYAASRRNIIGQVTAQFNRLVGEGASIEQVRRALVGTQAERYSNGALSGLMNQKGMFQTVSKMSVSASNQALWRNDPNVIGYVWSSVLDGKTSTTCMELNGRAFYYSDSGYQPHPPIHFNCRSSEEPIQRGKGKPKIETLNEFLKNNPTEAKEALGITRYQLFNTGKLRIDRFNDAFFRPLNLDELKKRNAIAFERAGV